MGGRRSGTGPAVMDSWHASLEVGSGAGGCMEFGWVADPRAGGPGAGGPQSLDGWHAAQELGELGVRGVWMGGTRLWSRAPADLMNGPGIFKY